uniref:Phage tail protein n=1 Tax=Anisakis simplex TaxID=6269 RepID=A0A0M3J8Y4_ANISI
LSELNECALFDSNAIKTAQDSSKDEAAVGGM